MDWNLAIERNRRALLDVLAALVAMAGWQIGGRSVVFSPAGAFDPGKDGLSPNVPAPTLPRHLHRAVMRLLRPAESVLRRLVVIAARGLAVPPPKPRPASPGTGPAILRGRRGTGIVRPRGGRVPTCPAGATPRALTLPMFDPIRRPARPRRPAANAVPRISVPGFGAPFAIPRRHPPLPWDSLDATRIVLRIDALARALDDLPARALRFARWQARRAAALEREREIGASRPRRVWPLRAGRPPGSCRRSRHEVHGLLKDVHGLALDVLDPRDTT